MYCTHSAIVFCSSTSADRSGVAATSFLAAGENLQAGSGSWQCQNDALDDADTDDGVASFQAPL